MYHKKNNSVPNETDLGDVIAFVNGPFREKRRCEDTGELSDEDQEIYNNAAGKKAIISKGLQAWLSDEVAPDGSVPALKEMISRSALPLNHKLHDLERMEDLGGKQDLEKLSKLMKIDEVFKGRNTAPAAPDPKQLKVRPRRVGVCTVACSS